MTASSEEAPQQPQQCSADTVAVNRPPWSSVVRRAAKLLVRHALLCVCVSVLVVQPLFFCLTRVAWVQALPSASFHVLVFALLSHAVPWLVFNGVFAFMDSLLPGGGGPRNAQLRAIGRHLARYKLPRKPAQQPSRALLRKTVISAQVSNWMVAPVITYVLVRRADSSHTVPRDRYIAGLSFGKSADPVDLAEALASLAIVAVHFVIANVVNEVGFYLAHSTLHLNGTLYRAFHKQHHEYKGTVSVAAEYAGLLEAVMANTLPTIGYFLFLFFYYSNDYPSRFVQTARVHTLLVTWMWARLWETYETHSGYCFSRSVLGRLGLLHGERAALHDFHHTHNAGNYGAGIFMDAALNTMDPYLRYQRRKTADATGKET